MPTVGDKKFPYTSAGVREAQLHARSTGQKVQMAKKGGMMKKGGTKKTALKYNKGGKKKRPYHHGGRVSGGMKDKQC